MTECAKQIEYKKAADIREKLQKKYPHKTEAEIQNALSRKVDFWNILTKVLLAVEIALIFFALITGVFSLFLRDWLMLALVIAAVPAGILCHKAHVRIRSKIPHPFACLPVLSLTLERIYRNCALQIPFFNASTASVPIRIIQAPVSRIERNHSFDSETQDEYFLFFGNYSYRVPLSLYEWATVGDVYYLVFHGQGNPLVIYSAATNRPDSVVSALLQDEEVCKEYTN